MNISDKKRYTRRDNIEIVRGEIRHEKVETNFSCVVYHGIMISSLPLQTMAAAQVKLNKTSATLYVGSSTTLKITGTTAKLWGSRNKAVATVNSKGVVTAKKVGTATIACAGKNGKTYTCKIIVKDPYLNAASKTLHIGETFALKITGTTATQWGSRNKAVATVDSNGVVTAKKAGAATIACAGKNGKTYTCKIAVEGHSYVIVSTEEPTCIKDGYKEYKCSSCGETYSETINKTNVHDYDMTKEVNRVAPTCGTEGYVEYKCKHCDNLYKKTLEKDASKHDYEVVKTDLMYKYLTCKHCKEETQEYNDTAYEIDMGNGKTKTIVGHYELGWAEEIGNLVNNVARKNAGVNPYTIRGIDTKLGEAAIIRAREVAVLADHTRPNGTLVTDSMYISHGILGENLAKGQKSAEEAFFDWCESPAHALAQIATKYSKMAVGVFAFKTGYNDQPYAYCFIEVFQ